MILRLLCIRLVFYSLLSSLILSNLKHELLNRLRSTMAANVLSVKVGKRLVIFVLNTVEPWIASNLVCECFTRRAKNLKEF
jgi:hypothetical protein